MKQTGYTLPFTEIRSVDLPLVGGKGANLGEMTRAGFPVPPGFCLTTKAFHTFVGTCPQMATFYKALAKLPRENLVATRKIGGKIRQALQALPVPEAVAAAVRQAWQALDPDAAYAVRSSATAEDLPDASFAGQQDTFLNVRGEAAVLAAIRDCWASLFTDRAILYRQQNGFDHREVALSVVVQQMVEPDISGILFTADPVSQNRHVASIDASFGLGEALVAGLVSADNYRVDSRSGRVIEAKIGEKALAIRPLPDGGTIRESLSEPQRSARVLGEEQAVALAVMGRRVAAHYGQPQDIEWAIAGDHIYLLQTRPITTLYPLPAPSPNDEALHLYVSLSHAQVMTDPIKRMGISIFQIIFPTLKSGGIIGYSQSVTAAGGRMYMDVTHLLNLRLGRKIVPAFLTMADETMAAAIKEVIARPNFLARLPNLKLQPGMRDVLSYFLPIIRHTLVNVFWRSPEAVFAKQTAILNSMVADSRQRLAAQPPGEARLRQARWELALALRRLLPQFPALVASGIFSHRLLAKVAGKRAKPDDLAAVARGLSGNVTTEMDLAVGDLADLVRQSPELVRQFQNLPPNEALAIAPTVPGSQPFLDGWKEFLDRYGMRGPSEIDISRQRWQEDPTSLLQFVVGNLQQAEPGSHRAHQAKMIAAGEAAAERLVAAAGQGLFGFGRRPLARRLVRAVRHYTPGREHPKFFLIQVMGLVKEVLLETAAALAANGRIDHPDDIWHLDLPELLEFVANPKADLRLLVAQRRSEFTNYRRLTPPRVITSEGEVITVQPGRKGLPEGALVGSAASSGTVEGIAKVVLDPTKDVLAKGEILVAPFTDPGWTPLFINAAALVMEVGGLMTHGSVVAREYGIPAVVSVPNATQEITSGQRIRVHGDAGYVEILDDSPGPNKSG